MAVAHVRVIRPRAGKLQELMNAFARTKKFHERNGATVRVYEASTGPNTGALLHIVETPNWKAYGEYRTKIEADPEFRAAMTEIRNNRDPLADIVSSEVVEEISIG